MIYVDQFSRVPVYLQIIEQIKKEIVLGLLDAESPAYSVRELSVQLSINPNTVQKAYTELERQGILYPIPGKGNFVAPNAMQTIQESILQEEEEGLKKSIFNLKSSGVTKDEILKMISKWIDTLYKEETVQ